MIAIARETIDPAALTSRTLVESGGAGALVTFTGVVRGGDVEELWLDHHPKLTLASLEAIAAATQSRFMLTALTIVHRVGALRPEDPIVFVAAAAEHRRAAFQAVDYAMDRLKTEAILWKRERRAERTDWIEARGTDHSDRARWEKQE